MVTIIGSVRMSSQAIEVQGVEVGRTTSRNSTGG
jgi:hypothetical protein